MDGNVGFKPTVTSDPFASAARTAVFTALAILAVPRTTWSAGSVNMTAARPYALVVPRAWGSRMRCAASISGRTDWMMGCCLTSVSTKTSSASDLARSYVARSSGCPCSPSGSTCFGVELRERGHSLVPAPPAGITATVRVIPEARRLRRRGRAIRAELFGELPGARGRLPGRVDVRAPEMAVHRGLAEQGPPKVQLLDDPKRAQVEELADRGRDRRIRQLARAGGVDADRDGLHDPDRVRDLHLAPRGETRGDHVLGNVASAVGAGAVDFRRVLAGEAATAVPGVAAIGVDHDLAPGQTCVGHRTAHHE